MLQELTEHYSTDLGIFNTVGLKHITDFVSKDDLLLNTLSPLPHEITSHHCLSQIDSERFGTHFANVFNRYIFPEVSSSRHRM